MAESLIPCGLQPFLNYAAHCVALRNLTVAGALKPCYDEINSVYLEIHFVKVLSK